MNTELIFCVDGGGTSTRARLYSSTGAQLAEARAGSCNVSTDPLEAAGSVTQAWSACAAAIRHDAALLDGVNTVIGAAGTLPPKSRAIFDAALPAFGTCEVVTDGYAALIGAGGGRPAGLIIAGTGAVGHRLLADGRSIRRDGFGWAGGDRGSGFWIGRKVLRHGVRAIEGLIVQTDLSRLLFDRIGGYAGFQDMVASLRPNHVAALAPIALDAARAGCPEAQGILDGAIRELAELVGLLDLPEDAPLYFNGGLAEALKPGLGARIGRGFDAPQADAVEGCRLIAMGQAPREITAAVGYPDPALVEGGKAERVGE
ncbi:MAG: hypothetical protein CML66_09325 [Rhodobacteraceae bacterium]|nr:hypothetical protein [Paracoccaceae bacterium]MAY47378.1 hypothetical protein [Paracoccaceae bacterium]